MKNNKTVSKEKYEKIMNQLRFELEDLFMYFDKKGINRESYFIAGGFISDRIFSEVHGHSFYWTDEDNEKDIDVFFIGDKGRESFDKLKQDITRKFSFLPEHENKDEIIFMKEKHGCLSFINKNININSLKEFKIQIIKTNHNSYEDVLKSFDLSVCCFGLSSDDYFFEEVCLGGIIKKNMFIVSPHRPTKILERISKYSRRGFKIDHSFDYEQFLFKQFKKDIHWLDVNTQTYLNDLSSNTITKAFDENLYNLSLERISFKMKEVFS